MRIGILTYHRAYNYGAYLQACALCGRLNREDGIEAEIIDYRMQKEVNFYEQRNYSIKQKLRRLLYGTYSFKRSFGNSMKKALDNPCMVLSKDSLTDDSIEAFASFVDNKYDVIVVGSDEVWKVDNFRGFPTAYWLFGDLHCRKFSYAASARVEFKRALSEADYGKLKSALADFEYIGVRDEYTKREVGAAIGATANVHLCCDPSFLFDFDVPASDIFNRISRKRGYRRGSKTILVMLDNEAAAQYIRRELGDRYNLVSVYNPHKGYINCPDVDPFEWLFLIQNTDFVIASFFHAICFSIINNRPFLAIGTKGKKSKLTELLGTPELMRHYIEIEDQPGLTTMVDDVMDSGESFDGYVSIQRESFASFLKQLQG